MPRFCLAGRRDLARTRKTGPSEGGMASGAGVVNGSEKSRQKQVACPRWELGSKALADRSSKIESSVQWVSKRSLWNANVREEP